MLQEIQDPNSAELALTLYQLATTYYAYDMLVDAGSVLQRATQLMRSHYPEDHDLVGGLCVSVVCWASDMALGDYPGFRKCFSRKYQAVS